MKATKYKESEIEHAKEVLKSAGYLSPMWHRDNVKGCIEKSGYKATKENIDRVIETLERSYDASQGINWDVINITIDLVLNP